jgi:hypothetical protein
VSTVGAAESDAANAPAAQVLLHFAGEPQFDALEVRIDFHGVVDRRELMLGKFDIESRADHLRDASRRLVGIRYHVCLAIENCVSCIG